jgi:eukaryotic-like serine/threonine-protein kinase
VDPERQRRIDELLQSTRQLSPEARAPFLRQACGGDADLEQHIWSLLRAQPDVAGFLDAAATRVTTLAQELREDTGAAGHILTGHTISHYRVLRPIDRGGMGIVYEAEDLRLGRHVALKVLQDSGSGQHKELLRFEQEARAIASLNHPNICTVFEVEEHDAQPVIVMELLKGVTLKQRMKAGPVGLQDLAQWGIEIADALGAAHERGVIHRDIKPANVFITSRGISKILDFGLAKLSTSDSDSSPLADQSLTTGGVVRGTTPYMSPEQVRGDDLDGRSDLFSLGVVLYEMATGRRPFDEKNVPLTMDAVLNKDPPPVSDINPGLPEALVRIVSKALEKDRGGRYQRASEIRSDLLMLRSGSDRERPTATPIHAASAPVAGQRGRLHWTKATVVAFAAVIVAVVGASVYQSRQSKPAGRLTDQDVLVVADFDNSTGDPVFDRALRQALAFQLQESPLLKAMDDAQVRLALQLSGKPVDTRLTGEVAREVCVREREKATLEGSIAPLGSSYLLALRAVNCRTGEVIVRRQATAPDKEHVVEALAQATTSLRARLGESLNTIPGDDRVYSHRVTTTSLEALEAFYLGDTEWSLTDNSRAAIPFYRRATELDPNFAMAWTILGMRYTTIGDDVHSRESIEKGYSLIDRVSERERLFITAVYERFNNRNVDKATEIYQVLTRTYPRDAVLHGGLSTLYLQRGELEKALAEAEASIKLGPKIVLYHRAAVSILMELNRMDDAKAVIDRARANGLESSSLHSQRLYIALAEGDRAAQDNELAWFAGKPEEAVALRHLANHAAAIGHHRRATQFFERAAALARERKSDIDPRTLVIERVAADALLGRCPARPSPQSPLPPLVIAICKADVAQKLVAQASQAGVAMTVGPPGYVRGTALLAEGRAEEAAALFEQMLARRATNWGPEYPAAQVGLARAAARSGDAAKARKAYDDFFALWKDADLDIPLLLAARNEYDALH